MRDEVDSSSFVEDYKGLQKVLLTYKIAVGFQKEGVELFLV